MIYIISQPLMLRTPRKIGWLRGVIYQISPLRSRRQWPLPLAPREM